jgi:pimeloyl-ACP methyl ester carboxylesterase
LARRYWLILNARRIALLAAAIALFTLFVVLPVYIAYSAVHPSSCKCSPTPSKYGLHYMNFTARTVDGVEVNGWIVEPNNTGDVFILLHPYMGCRSHPLVMNLTVELARRNYVVVAFDFRGHGCSGGGYTTIGVEEVRDAQAVVNYVATRYPDRRIYMVGFSMGAAVAIVEAASDPLVAGVAADAPYCNLGVVTDLWVSREAKLPLGPLALFYARSLLGLPADPNFGPCMLKRFNKPLLVVHEEHDPLVTRVEAEKIASLSPCGKLLEVPGVGHVDAVETLGVEKFVDTVLEYFSNATRRCPPSWPAG